MLRVYLAFILIDGKFTINVCSWIPVSRLPCTCRFDSITDTNYGSPNQLIHAFHLRAIRTKGQRTSSHSHTTFHPLATRALADMGWWQWKLQAHAASQIHPLHHFYIGPRRDTRWTVTYTTLTVAAVKPGLIKSSIVQLTIRAEQQTVWCLLDSRLILMGLHGWHASVISNPYTPGAPQNCCIPLTIPPPHTNLTFLFQSAHN